MTTPTGRGRARYLVATQTDVTERILAERERDRVKERLTTAIEIMEDAFLMVGGDGTVLYANAALAEALPAPGPDWRPGTGLTHNLHCFRREAAQRPSKPALGPEDLFELARSGGSRELRLPSGRSFLLRARSGPDGSLVVTAANITRLKLVESQMRTRVAAIEAARDGIVMVNSDERIVYLNAAAAGLLGFDPPEMALGRDWRDRYDAPDWPGPRSVLARFSGAGDTPRTHEITRSLLGGDVPGRPGAAVLILRDATERLTAAASQSELRAALARVQRQEAVSHIAAGLAHDFANLLATIGGAAAEIAGGDPMNGPRPAERSSVDAVAGRSRAIGLKSIGTEKDVTDPGEESAEGDRPVGPTTRRGPLTETGPGRGGGAPLVSNGSNESDATAAAGRILEATARAGALLARLRALSGARGRPPCEGAYGHGPPWRGDGPAICSEAPRPCVTDLTGATVLVVDRDRETGEILHAFLEALGAEVALCDSPAVVADALREEPKGWTALIAEETGAESGPLAEALAVAPDLPLFIVTTRGPGSGSEVRPAPGGVGQVPRADYLPEAASEPRDADRDGGQGITPVAPRPGRGQEMAETVTEPKPARARDSMGPAQEAPPAGGPFDGPEPTGGATSDNGCPAMACLGGGTGEPRPGCARADAGTASEGCACASSGDGGRKTTAAEQTHPHGRRAVPAGIFHKPIDLAALADAIAAVMSSPPSPG